MRASAWFWLGLGMGAVGCGGNVVVDGSTKSTGGSVVGSGGGVVGSGGGVVGTGGSPVSCPNAGCAGDQDSCQCEGMCTDGHTRSVTCSPIPPETSCACALDQMVIGKCTTEPDVAPNCDLVGSCCAAIFAGASSGG
jgi:hypothetical protein